MGKPTEVHCINKIYEITSYHIQSQLNCLPWTTLKSQGVTISYTILCNITFSLTPIDNIKFPFEDLSLSKKSLIPYKLHHNFQLQLPLNKTNIGKCCLNGLFL